MAAICRRSNSVTLIECHRSAARMSYITGFINIEAAMGGKWVELLKEIAPSLSRLALMFNPDTAPAGGAQSSGQIALYERAKFMRLVECDLAQRLNAKKTPSF